MQRRKLLGALSAAAFGCLSGYAQAASGAELFRIGRSKNKNVVIYEARGGPTGLSTRAPISSYWRMLAEDGRREELTWAERQLAYGFDVTEVSPAGCRVTLSACPKRSLRVERYDGGFRALCTIAGRRGVLERIYVHATEGALLPSVQHVDLFGKTLGGEALRERLTP